MVLDELARQVFSFLCHQDPARTFQPGSVPLALCARCVGVYMGFVLTIPMLFMLRFLSRSVATWLHGAFVLQVVVFGFHLIPHGLTLRTVSGQLFAVGVVYFVFRAIWRAKGGPSKTAGPSKTTGRWLMRYLLGTAQAVVLVQLLLRLGWAWAATLINILALAGLGAFAGLVAAFLVALSRSIAGWRRAVRVQL